VRDIIIRSKYIKSMKKDNYLFEKLLVINLLIF